MKAKDSHEARQLEDVPNIGNVMAEKLRMIGIAHPGDLRGRDGLDLYRKLNQASGSLYDPCVADVFLAAVDFMNGNAPRPWWTFTHQRKQILRDHEKKSGGAYSAQK